MKRLLLGVFIGFGLMMSTANADDNGIEAAEKACQDMSYAPTVTKCLEIVHSAEYFNERAVAVCKDMSYAPTVMKCLTAIKDQRYSDTAVTTCKDMSYAPTVIKCFETSGRKGKPAASLDREFVIKNLRRALTAIRDGRDDRAEDIIESVIEGLK